MIDGAHVVLFVPDAEATRAFLRDTVGLPGVDAGDGWIIFALPPAEVAAHPTAGPVAHELYLTCDDLEATLADLRARGVELADEPSTRDWGVVVRLKVPGGGTIGLYEPRHARPSGAAG
jgi:catechol 2,3-dioxygenase-like lactoylglutathione lyase family enzyme